LTRLYFDHNFTRHVAPILWAEGHDLLFTRDPGTARLTDDAHLLASVRAGRVLITHDRHDFKMLHDAWVTWPAAFGMRLPPHLGVLVLDSASPETLAQVIADFLDGTDPADLPDAIFWWHRHDGWRRSIDGSQWEPHEPDRASGQE
jgi:hypothetical protein